MLILFFLLALVPFSVDGLTDSPVENVEYIAGYQIVGGSVEQHNKIDLDVEIIANVLKNQYNGKILKASGGDSGTLNIDLANSTYYYGGNSRTSPPYRTTMGFSTDAYRKQSKYLDKALGVRLIEEPVYAERVAYWQYKGILAPDRYDFGHAIIDAAIKNGALGNDAVAFAGKGRNGELRNDVFTFAGKGDDFRIEVIKKSVVYQNVYNYIIWEMQDAINDCKVLEHSNPGSTNSVHAWDEAVAFYTGSLEGTAEGGLQVSSNSQGQLMYGLANKRGCNSGNFDTCTGKTASGHQFSKVNENIFGFFNLGQNQITKAFGTANSSKCADVESTKKLITQQMLVPLIQGTLRYLYKCRYGFSTAGCEAKEAGELFAFASGILPHLHAADSAVAEKLYKMSWEFDTSASYSDIKSSIESTYSKLGITCADVGTLDLSKNPEYGVCGDDENAATPWGIVLVVMFSLLLC